MRLDGRLPQRWQPESRADDLQEGGLPATVLAHEEGDRGGELETIEPLEDRQREWKPLGPVDELDAA